MKAELKDISLPSTPHSLCPYHRRWAVFRHSITQYTPHFQRPGLFAIYPNNRMIRGFLKEIPNRYRVCIFSILIMFMSFFIIYYVTLFIISSSLTLGYFFRLSPLNSVTIEKCVTIDIRIIYIKSTLYQYTRYPFTFYVRG